MKPLRTEGTDFSCAEFRAQSLGFGVYLGTSALRTLVSLVLSFRNSLLTTILLFAVYVNCHLLYSGRHFGVQASTFVRMFCSFLYLSVFVWMCVLACVLGRGLCCVLCALVGLGSVHAYVCVSRGGGGQGRLKRDENKEGGVQRRVMDAKSETYD